MSRTPETYAEALILLGMSCGIPDAEVDADVLADTGLDAAPIRAEILKGNISSEAFAVLGKVFAPLVG